MSKKPDFVVMTTPSYQPIANKAHKILQEAIVALSKLEIEAGHKHYAEDDALDKEWDEHDDLDIEDKEHDEWWANRTARIKINTRMEHLYRDLHNIVSKLESGLGAVEDYR
tara:strand:- start:333 stop:665 length:333 start_codon:yes stop_codon:yes gene_type:complete